MTGYMNRVQEDRQKGQESTDRYMGIKKRKLEDGTYLIEMPIRFIKYVCHSVIWIMNEFICVLISGSVIVVQLVGRSSGKSEIESVSVG